MSSSTNIRHNKIFALAALATTTGFGLTVTAHAATETVIYYCKPGAGSPFGIVANAKGVLYGAELQQVPGNSAFLFKITQAGTNEQRLAVGMPGHV